MSQTYATHRQWVPLWHFFALPVSLVNFFVVAVRAFKSGDGFVFANMWMVVMALAFAVVAFLARNQAIVVQNRLIRLEERLRLRAVLPAAMHGKINDLSVSQLIGLRFASDGELAGLVDRCLSGQLKGAEEVKKEIKTWVGDTLRA